ncbi:hypothetical protein Bbelb_432590 [Branchiostoma belcheri]|nr:hypothetical protein Bbelb_432590 [Branchiostoma belcheri]
MKVNLVLILTMTGWVRGQITLLGERRRGTVDKICRTFCPDCSPSILGGATSSSLEATDYCRRNPTALSCELARRDPERAIRVFQDNQWAFIRGGPSDEEEPAENDNFAEREGTTVGGGGQGGFVPGSSRSGVAVGEVVTLNQQEGGELTSTVLTGTDAQGGRPTGGRDGGTLEEVTRGNPGGGSSSVVVTGGGSQGVVLSEGGLEGRVVIGGGSEGRVLTGGGSGGRVVTGGGSEGRVITGGGSGGRVLTEGGSGGRVVTGGGSEGRVITGGGSGGRVLTGGGSGGRVVTGGGSEGRVITGGGSGGRVLTGGGSGGRVLTGGGSGGRVLTGGGSGGSVLTGGRSGGSVLTGGGSGGRVLTGGGSGGRSVSGGGSGGTVISGGWVLSGGPGLEGRVIQGGRVASRPVFSTFVEGHPQVERVTGNVEERFVNAPLEVGRSSQNAPYNGGDVREGRVDGRSFYVSEDGQHLDNVAGERIGTRFGPDQSHARHARAVTWMDVCRTQGTLVTPSRVYLNGAWTDIELYSLQVRRSVFQRFYAVKCVESTPTANCQGECRDKRSQFPALEIYKDGNDDLQVRPRLVDVTTCCQLLISA